MIYDMFIHMGMSENEVLFFGLKGTLNKQGKRAPHFETSQYRYIGIILINMEAK